MTGPLPPGRAGWLAVHILPVEPALRGWLARRGVGHADVDDVVQESYATLAALADVAHIDSPRAYLFRTAWSLIVRQVRRAQVVSIQTMADLAVLDIELDAPGAERQFDSRQELRRLAAAIDSLPPRCREIFTLRKVEGLSQRQVAARTGLAESTVEKHVGKAIRLLGERFASDDHEAAPPRRPALKAKVMRSDDRA